MPEAAKRRLRSKIDVHAKEFMLKNLCYGSFELRAGAWCIGAAVVGDSCYCNRGS